VKRALLFIAGLALAFILGIALGQALGDTSGTAGTQTIVRTLKPLPLAPAARETVTVTASTR
jgi:hypothetical protein